MRTLIPDPAPAHFEVFLEQRRRAGADRFDEVWKGVLHVSPDPSRGHGYIVQQLAELLGPLARAAGLVPGISSFNLGESRDDYRAPDGGLFRGLDSGVWNLTAALVLEVVSPGDYSWEKFDFYAAHAVDEVLIVDPRTRSVDWLGLVKSEYIAIERSGLIALGAAELAQQLDWPPIEA
jgi:Uma2 family endonuclease